MQIANEQLINELLQLTEQATQKACHFKSLSQEQLNYKATPGQWSILECIEHLNLYGDFYLVEIEQRLLNAARKEGMLIFKSGIIGNYFAGLMKAKNGKVKKMRSPKDKNPVNRDLPLTTIDRFLKQQEKLKQLLQQAVQVDMVNTRTAISISKWIKLRLGDCFRFFIYHIERHMAQAERLLQALS